MYSKRKVEAALARAGIAINGSRPWDMRVHNERLYRRVLLQGSVGLGEGYMDGWWDCPRLDEFFSRVLSAGVDSRFRFSPVQMWARLTARVQNLATVARSYRLGQAHYDLGNNLYTAMLGPSMAYTCARWDSGVTSLDQAQEAKLRYTCGKLDLRPGMSVLDIGCGFGPMARHLGANFGASVTGVSVSREQVEYGNRWCQGLPVQLKHMDYRELGGQQFDRVVSLGMAEHMGPKSFRQYLQAVRRHLKPDGICLIHTIGKQRAGQTDPWIYRYIFPCGQVPTEDVIRGAAKNVLAIRDWDFWGSKHYDNTLMAWHNNFTRAWPELEQAYAQRWGGRFRRGWEYYLLCCAGAFRARTLEVWQVTMTAAAGVEYVPLWERGTGKTSSGAALVRPLPFFTAFFKRLFLLFKKV